MGIPSRDCLDVILDDPILASGRSPLVREPTIFKWLFTALEPLSFLNFFQDRVADIAEPGELHSPLSLVRVPHSQ